MHASSYLFGSMQRSVLRSRRSRHVAQPPEELLGRRSSMDREGLSTVKRAESLARLEALEVLIRGEEARLPPTVPAVGTPRSLNDGSGSFAHRTSSTARRSCICSVTTSTIESRKADVALVRHLRALRTQTAKQTNECCRLTAVARVGDVERRLLPTAVVGPSQVSERTGGPRPTADSHDRRLSLHPMVSSAGSDVAQLAQGATRSPVLDTASSISHRRLL